MHLGYYYEKLKNRPKAVGYYVRVITNDYPLADSAAYRLAKLYAGMKNDTKTKKWYTQLINNYPESIYMANAKWTLAELHLKYKNYKEAKSVLVDITNHPTYGRKATYALCRCEEGLGNYSEAFKIHQRLINEKQSDSDR